MGIFDRLFREQLEYHNGRIYFQPWTWVFDPTKRELKNHPRWVSTRKDASGQLMTLVKRRGVLCYNPEMGDRYPRSIGEKTLKCNVPGTVCQKCEHYRKGGLGRIKRPHCAWARKERGGTSGSAKEVCKMVTEAVNTTSKMMGR